MTSRHLINYLCFSLPSLFTKQSNSANRNIMKSWSTWSGTSVLSRISNMVLKTRWLTNTSKPFQGIPIMILQRYWQRGISTRFLHWCTISARILYMIGCCHCTKSRDSLIWSICRQRSASCKASILIVLSCIYDPRRLLRFCCLSSLKTLSRGSSWKRRNRQKPSWQIV